MIVSRWRDFFSTNRIEQTFRSTLSQEAEGSYEDEPDDLAATRIALSEVRHLLKTA